MLKPRWIFSVYPRGTTHGQPHPDDQRVPVAFYGAGVKAGRHPGSMSPRRIARTLLERLQIAAPDLPGPLPLQ